MISDTMKDVLHRTDTISQLYIDDIYVPPILYSRLGLDVNPQVYAKKPVIRLRKQD